MKHTILFALLAALVLAVRGFCASVAADHNVVCARGKKLVSVELPGGDIRKITVDWRDLHRYVRRTRLPKGIRYANSYKIDVWVYAALIKMGLKFDGHTVPNPNKDERQAWPYLTTITEIGGYKNCVVGTWTLFVNGKLATRPIDVLDDSCAWRRITYKYLVEGSLPATPLIPLK